MHNYIILYCTKYYHKVTLSGGGLKSIEGGTHLQKDISNTSNIGHFENRVVFNF